MQSKEPVAVPAGAAKKEKHLQVFIINGVLYTELVEPGPGRTSNAPQRLINGVGKRRSSNEPGSLPQRASLSEQGFVLF